ncbi:MAG: iron-sulfur cluster assembly scaffold protein [Theionarchaea archaeon]|nr:MAG: iron-sulfur cluster assembly scaffold protein [Theionarchaea archaeon DG-70]MBU7009746.1 iron-sulfur cluster assembly scaffold protein [Theionarchaea archaeon]
MVEYSETLLDHFQNPRNVGIIEDADGIGKLSSDVCGDIMHLYIRVKNGKITDAKFTTFGCAAAVASGSMLTEMIKGLSIEKAVKITKQDIADSLDGVPEPKMHCSLLAADCLRLAVEDYKKRLET